MDYFAKAFGGFDPQADRDAAFKFVLNSLLLDDRIQDLLDLLTENHEIGGLEGDPGWALQRRDAENAHMPGYANWPKNATFRAFVEPAAYSLGHPEYFADTKVFHGYVQKAIAAYVARNPAKAGDVAEIASRLSKYAAA